MSWNIETLKEKDLTDAVKALQKLAGGQGNIPFADPEATGRAIYGPHAITLIAKKNGNIVGIVSGTTMTNPPTLAILSAADQESVNKELSGRLVDRFLEELRKKAASATMLRTTLPATAAAMVALFSEKGFVVDGFYGQPMSQRGYVMFLNMSKIFEKQSSSVV